MRFIPPVVLLLAVACRIETADSGKPHVPRAPADSPAGARVDSAALGEVAAVLGEYYELRTAGNWRSLRERFWPGATVVVIGAAQPGRPMSAWSVEAFSRMRRGPSATQATASQSWQIRLEGDAAAAWVPLLVRADAGARSPTDLFLLARQGREWRIAGAVVADDATAATGR
jgi:hypothetical protein